jgi:putative transposase
MREIYFWDPSNKTYIPIPYRDRARPPVSRWEIQAAEKRLREAGYARVDEALIFQAVEEMRKLEQESEHNKILKNIFFQEKCSLVSYTSLS